MTKPLDCHLEVAEAMCDARSNYINAMNDVLRKLDSAQTSTNEKHCAEVVQNVDLAKIRARIYQAMSAAEMVEDEHKKLAKEYEALGYEKVQSSMFSRTGTAGTTRR